MGLQGHGQQGCKVARKQTQRKRGTGGAGQLRTVCYRTPGANGAQAGLSSCVTAHVWKHGEAVGGGARHLHRV